MLYSDSANKCVKMRKVAPKLKDVEYSTDF